MKNICILTFLLLVGCNASPEPLEYHRSSQRVLEDVHREQAAQFVIDCAKAANPHSDEEGEDLVEQCEETSLNFYSTFKHSCAVIRGYDLVMTYQCTDSRMPEPCKAICPQ